MKTNENIIINKKMESALDKFKRKCKNKEYGDINKEALDKLIKALDKKIGQIEKNND
jgi:hypothetical protein